MSKTKSIRTSLKATQILTEIRKTYGGRNGQIMNEATRELKKADIADARNVLGFHEPDRIVKVDEVTHRRLKRLAVDSGQNLADIVHLTAALWLENLKSRAVR